ncbi:P-loop containing nucleoside triphosphate hydrolase protein [Polychytrium aggregatum]|uniref:P-loop containing nucleoside triphosphate hydrolase protein n=1 Tax=Polychytrium aggregatum TaxID=110093 RepID=UPI0022FF36E5|nr:P-loop containing nucleoside triphosphate hydrolase protein [Polychytrium aggregatum]KAI9209831.1 P-loop containing nucleoside triphosphate hydrolase protein [Polychytrium aggregatum]
MDSAGNNIRVVCRFRPQNSREIKEGGVHIVSFSEDMTTVNVESKEYPGTYAFDRIFDWDTNQAQVFEYAASAVVEDVMKGYNGTIFAYGQTGSGKTHTMMGNMEDEEYKGLTPRLVESIFATIYNAPSNLEFTVKVSYMEIYNEKVRDLLNPQNDNLPIHEEKSRGVYVKGLLESFVGSVAEVYEAMRRGQAARVVGYTNMNAESSRSHSIFVIQVGLKNLTDGSQRTGKLYLVDLAGSEKVGKTGATGQTLEEAKKINKSLSALGMVINALTDGKSSHIPYRDSKLTRILQESLGGNSRTTLIINCSPSSFNEAETVSTLRFGMRAKTIKNKAKVNAELSTVELKTLLKKAKADFTQLHSYAGSLEGEISLWRSGVEVPQEQWVPLKGINGDEVPPVAAPTPSVTPAQAANLADIAARAATPAPVGVTDDEREDFLRRENELSDQIADKEAELKTNRDLLESLNEELAFLKTKDTELTTENKKLVTSVNEVTLQLEKVTYENKENSITVDSLREANQELNKEIEGLKKQVIEAQASKPVVVVNEEDKEKKKQEKMEQMMAEFDPSGFMSDKEKQIRDTLSKLAYMKENSSPPTDPAEIESQHRELLEAKTQVAQQTQIIDELTTKAKAATDDVTLLTQRKQELEQKLANLEAEYEELLDKTIQEEEQNASVDIAAVIQDLKSKLETQYANKRELQEGEIEDLKNSLVKKDQELQKSQAALAEQVKANGELKTAAEALRRNASPSLPDNVKNEEIEKMRRVMAQQLAEFDAMKKKLMRDLQNRCERVVELEVSLDETREQYNSILRNSNSRAQQQKMVFLERNLEQLTNVQKQLVEQNATLKKELAVAERKLVARNERIQNLETLLQDAQTKLELQNQKFEAQLTAMREKLQEARFKYPDAGSNSWLYSSRIAKPLRGGGVAPVAGELDEPIDFDGNNANGKRASWYISLLKR